MEINNTKKVLMLFFLLLSISLVAQKKVWEKFGNESMEAGDGYSASKFYEKAIAYDSSDVKLQYKLAKAHMSYQNFPKALPICLKIQQQFFTKPGRSIDEELKTDLALLSYDLGRIYKYYGVYDTAQFYFSEFVKKGNKALKEQYWAKNELDNWDKLLALVKDTGEVELKHLLGNVNTAESEFASVMVDDSTFIFTSLKAISISDEGTIEDEDYHANLYLAVKTDSIWVVKNKIRLEGKKDVSIANGSFNSNKTKFYFTVCEKNIGCSIYEGVLGKDSLKSIEALPETINGLQSNSTHPFLVEMLGRKFLFFSSNRAGGQGGMDLWVSEFKNVWGAPKNLGKQINSRGDEISPYYDLQKNELYFSSNWHYNLGGFDIFKSNGFFPSKWEAPNNLGIPFNSNLNDLYFSLQDSARGFLTSSREGSITEKDVPCCNDIYSFEKQEAIIDLMIDTIKVIEELAIDSATIKVNLNDLKVAVYFHNDRPNKDSWDTLTSLNYETTYFRYTPLFDSYKKEYSSQFTGLKSERALKEVDTFFNDFLFKGYKDLIVFTDELIDNLNNGKSVDVLLQGFASPLTKTNYNVNLSKRRISSVLNFLLAYKNGVLLPYYNGTAKNKASLQFVKKSNGEYKAKEGVSDDYYDVKNSIYNPKAALERKVEISATIVQPW